MLGLCLTSVEGRLQVLVLVGWLDTCQLDGEQAGLIAGLEFVTSAQLPGTSTAESSTRHARHVGNHVLSIHRAADSWQLPPHGMCSV